MAPKVKLYFYFICLFLKNGGQSVSSMGINDSFRMLNLNIILGVQLYFSVGH